MKKSFVFSALGSLIIIAFLFTVNYMTSWGHPWFIYPTFLVLWWPLSMFFAGNKNFKAFSIAGSILVTAFFFLVNMITSPSFPWFIFPTFAVWWWPMSMYIVGSKKYKLFSVVASLYTIVFFLVINLVTTNTIWFIYPAFAILWWPISHIICGAKKYKLYSIVSSIYLVAFLALVNYITSPGYAWFYYAAYAVIWWPMSMFLLKKNWIKAYSLIMMLLTVAYLALINLLNTPNEMWFQYTIFYLMWWPLVMFLGKRAKTVAFSVVGAALIIAYHALIHYLVTPLDHPWYLYLVLPAVWWPVSMALRRHLHRVWFLLLSILVTIVYYVALNIIISPGHFWSIYIIYPALWAVISMYFGRRKEYFALSIAGTLLTTIFFIIVNYITTPNVIWAIYPIFAIVWWPVSLYFGKRREYFTLSIVGSILISAFFIAVNYITSPKVMWAIYPIFATLWWPISLYFGKRKKYLALSIACSLLTIAFFVIVNYITSPNVIWAIYPSFVILWWPLSLYFYRKRKKAIEEN